MYDSSDRTARLKEILDQHKAANKIRDMVDALCHEINELKTDKLVLKKVHDSEISTYKKEIDNLRSQLEIAELQQISANVGRY